MAGYILRRSIQSLITVVGVTVIVFVLVHLLPGGPAHAILGAHYTAGKLKALDQQLGLTKPAYLQYFVWLAHLAQGNLGYSYIHQLPVTSLIASALPNSVLLAGLAVLEALFLAIPLATFQALRPKTLRDYVLTTLNFFLYSMPVFFLGSVAILYLAVDHNIFPVGGVLPPGATGLDLGERLYHVILPSTTLALVQLAAWSRYLRASLLDALVQDYMRTARAKGLSLRAAVRKHALRNALLPIITLLGLSLPALIGGVVVVESVFDYPGMGYLLWQGAQQYDFPVILGVALLASVATVIGNLLADLCYAIADPRIRYA
jgi:peptide/nickel transport system permease protein